MKRFKKLLSIIVVLSMMLQILPVFAQEVDIVDNGVISRPVNYIINDNFASTDADDSGFDGWSLNKTSEGVSITEDVTYVTTEPEYEGSDNYLLKYSSGSNTDSYNTFVRKTFDTPVKFEEGKDVVIETKVMQTLEGGRSFLKYNLKRDGNWNEYDKAWGTLLMNNQGNLYVPNGWATYMNTVRIADDTTSKWFDIKITIHGNTKKASYEVTNLSTTPATVYQIVEKTNIAHKETANWVEDALNSLEFTLRNPQTLYVDYVKVYVPEQKELALNLANGRYVEYNDSVVLDVTTDEEELYIPDGTVILTNSAGTEVSAAAEYDETNKKFTLTPAENLVPGAIYTVTVNENAFIKTATGYSNSFEIEAKEEATEGYTVSDTFDDLGLGTTDDASGWYLGTVKDGVGGAIAIVDKTTDPNAEGATGKALKLTGDVQHATDDGMQTILTKKLGGGIKYKEGETVTLRTRIKYMGEGRVIFEENRPDTLKIPSYLLSNNYYNLFVQTTGGISYQTGVSGTTGGTTSAFSGDYSKQWLDVTMVIDGCTQEMTITLKPENAEAVTKTGSIKRCAAVWTNHFGKNTNKSAFDALERLSFTFRQAGGDLYIDYVEVYEAPDVKAQLSEGRFVQYNKPVEIKLMSEKAIPEAVGKEFAKAVTIDGVETVNTYDESTQTVILSHSGLVSDKKYTVSVDSDVVSGIGVVYSGTTSWEIWARDERKTGSVISDDFDQDNDIFNKGATKTGKEGKVEYTTHDGKSVLKLTSGVLGLDNGEQSNVFSMLNGGIEFDSSKDIVIKTSFMHESENTRVFLKFNRPDTITLPGLENVGNLYTLLSLNEGAAMAYPVGVSDTDDRQVALKSIDKGGNYANKWIDAEIVIHGKNGGVSVKTSYTDDDGNKVTKTAEGSIANPASVYTHAYGIGTAKTGFDALESLTFTFRGDGVTDTLYVDYVEVYTRNTFKASVNFFGEDKTSTTTITDGMKVVPVFDFYDESNGDYLAISVMYKNGKILDIHTMPVKAGYGVRVEDEGWVIADATNIVIKSFVWNSLDKLMPVSNATSLAGDVAEPLKKIYVAENGDDNVATGEKTSPVASISRAIEIAKNATESDEVEIIVEDGTYYLDKTISVNATNHVTDKLTIKAAEGTKPVIVNGKAVKLSEAEKVTDSSILSRLAEEKAKDNLYQISLKGMDIPQINLPGAYSYAADGLQTATGTFRFEESKTATCEIFFDGQPMTVARYPNGEYLNVNNVIEEGSITRHWMSDAGGNLVPVNQRIATPFSITESRATKWTTAKDALMFGYWKHDWATQTVPVANISGTTITSKYPSHYGVGVGQRYYVYNLLEEIDVPGEYYIDRDKEILYFMLPVGASTDGEDEFIISLNDFDMLNVSASNVIVDGLTFSATRNEAIELSGSNITVKNCEITNAAGTAVMISGTNNSIEGCNIHNVNGGISVNSGDSSTFTAGNNIISGNTISDYSRINKAYTFAVSLKGSGNKLTDNEIYNGEHTAVYFEGTNHVIEYNNIHDVCKEVDDAGAIYSNRSWVNRGNEIVYNYIHDIRPVVESKQGVAGIFLDDHFAGAFIKGNVFADITGSGIRTNQGRENVITNNIFVKCSDYGCSITSINNPVASSYATQIKGVEKYLNNSLWQQKYSGLFATDNLGKAMVNTDELIYGKDNEYTKNLSVACGNGYSIGTYATTHGNVTNNKVLGSDPGFGDMAGKDYSITPDKTGIEGFEEIPFSRMK